MTLDHAHLPPPSRHEQSHPADTRFSGSWLVLVRVAWVIVVVLAVGIFIMSIPFKSTNTAYLVFSLIFELVYLVTSVAIFWYKSGDRMALVTSFALVTFGTAFQVSTLAAGSFPPVVYILSLGLAFLGNTCLGLFFYVFPTGQFVPRWTRWLAICWIAYWGFNNVFLASFISAPGLNAVVFLSFLASVVPLQVYRYRRVSTPEQRRQTKWVIFGLSVAIVGFLVSITVVANFSQPLVGPLLYLFLLFIPLSLGVAILRSRLWDIDIIINRTLVYGTLTACVITLYVLLVVLLGALFQASGNLLISLLATGLIAVLFQPLRERLQRLINRLMFGERDAPYTVISRLGKRLEATVAPDAMLLTIVETVAQALKLPYAAITLKHGDAFLLAASQGTAQGELVHLPLLSQAELVGEIILAPRAPGEQFTPADRRLLGDLARQAGIAAHAVRLTEDLRHLTRDLQRSREQLVSAREEERRRLRRDLHDGLGPQLASLTLKLETARNRLAYDPLADSLLADLTSRTQAAVADIRHLVYALRPSVLDELGLVSALREQALQYSQQGPLLITCEAPEPLPPLSAAIEVASYRIAQEALTNVVRHARATRCHLRLVLDEATGILSLEIQDNGCGLSPMHHRGVGLTSMRERAEELGGTWMIEAVSTGGTRIFVRFPSLSSEMGDSTDRRRHSLIEEES